MSYIHLRKYIFRAVDGNRELIELKWQWHRNIPFPRCCIVSETEDEVGCRQRPSAPSLRPLSSAPEGAPTPPRSSDKTGDPCTVALRRSQAFLRTPNQHQEVLQPNQTKQESWIIRPEEKRGEGRWLGCTEGNVDVRGFLIHGVFGVITFFITGPENTVRRFVIRERHYFTWQFRLLRW